ncbi:ABC transporter ATP-binding protein [Marinibaculum pumilum]|uniref:ABC transporter ATP-binding protein n=1 Tax=Marinibaculum pumilum TaxID=1766165 RepID=A0ABV7L4I6_9PROT
MSAAAGLQAEAVTVRFGGLVAIDRVDLTLAQGEILGLIGPNGAGKSTLINVLSGFQRPSSGELRIDGTRMTGAPAHALARRGVARTFQAVRLFAGLSVRDNVAAARCVKAESRTAGDARVDEILDWLGLAAHADRQAGTMPYSAERLLGVARALAVEPRFLMLDEPAAGMNAEEVEQLVDLIGRIRDRFGCGVLVVEHNMAVIMSLCERVQVIDHGATIAIGTPEDVADDPEVRRAYLGEEDDDLPPEEAVSDGPGGEVRP